MTKTAFRPFPFSHAHYLRNGAALRQAWPRLHQGDQEPFPDAPALRKMIAAHKALAPDCSMEKACAQLQDAWRAYHAGAFGDAIAAGTALGKLGANVANKARNIYATYLETNEAKKLSLFLESAVQAEELQAAAARFSQCVVFSRSGAGPLQPGNFRGEGAGPTAWPRKCAAAWIARWPWLISMPKRISRWAATTLRSSPRWGR